MRSLRPATLLCACLAAGPVLAGASGWEKVEGGALRIVTESAPDTDGHLQGGLEIRLKPGWKTYWRDPGDAGVPPQVEITVDGRPAEARVEFPAPRRFDDGYAVWAGYDRDVILPFRVDTGGRLPATLRAEIFIGMCDEICVPVQVSLEVDVGNPDGVAATMAGLAALPKPAHEGFEAKLEKIGKDGIEVTLSVPAGAGDVALYVASSATHMLGVPEFTGSADSARQARVPVLSGPKDGAASAEAFAYTIVTDRGAVSGTLAP